MSPPPARKREPKPTVRLFLEGAPLAKVPLTVLSSSGRPYPWQSGTGTKACLAARQHGALLRQLGDTVVIMPPLSITAAELDSLMDAAEAGIVAVTGDG